MHRLENDKVYKHFIERTRLGKWHEAFLYGTVTLVWLSGLAWILFHHFGAHPGEFGPVASPIEPLSLKIHGAAAIAFTLVLGSLVPSHMRRGWVLNRNRPSGVFIVSICAGLVITGWGLYYAGGDRSRAALALVHWTVGLALPLIIYLHILASRRETRLLEQNPIG